MRWRLQPQEPATPLATEGFHTGGQGIPRIQTSCRLAHLLRLGREVGGVKDAPNEWGFGGVLRVGQEDLLAPQRPRGEDG